MALDFIKLHALASDPFHSYVSILFRNKVVVRSASKIFKGFLPCKDCAMFSDRCIQCADWQISVQSRHSLMTSHALQITFCVPNCRDCGFPVGKLLTCDCGTSSLATAGAAESLATAKDRYHVWEGWGENINASNAKAAPPVDVMKGEMCVGMPTLVFPPSTSSP